jgi:hypothetical protein
MFSERLKKVLDKKKKWEQAIEDHKKRAILLAAPDAERDFPKIIETIERAALPGQSSCQWSLERCISFDAEYKSCQDQVCSVHYFRSYQAYAEAYRDRVISLLANPAFHAGVKQTSCIWYGLSISW